MNVEPVLWNEETRTKEVHILHLLLLMRSQCSEPLIYFLYVYIYMCIYLSNYIKNLYLHDSYI